MKFQLLVALVLSMLGAVCSSFATAQSRNIPLNDVPVDDRTPIAGDETAAPRTQSLVEAFTAHTLASGQTKLGLDLDQALTNSFMLGTDMLANVVGAPSVNFKWRVFSSGPHSIAIGGRGAYLDRNTLLWGSLADHFDVLHARIFRPAVAWTNKISPTLEIHTYFAAGMGSYKIRLSPEGRRKLWESKYPSGDYDSATKTAPGDAPPSDTRNQERVASDNSSYAQRTLQVSAITGILTDQLQITGDITRADGNKILLTTRIQRSHIEDLKANSFVVTAAQQWIWPYFQFRLGVGLQYALISGQDLDGEKIDDSGILPASDITFYWIF